MLCLLYTGPLNFLPQAVLSVNTHNIDVYHVSLPAHDNYFHHLTTISVFHPHNTGEPALNSCYFVFARVFANNMDLGDDEDTPSLIFVLEKVLPFVFHHYDS